MRASVVKIVDQELLKHISIQPPTHPKFLEELAGIYLNLETDHSIKMNMSTMRYIQKRYKNLVNAN